MRYLPDYAKHLLLELFSKDIVYSERARGEESFSRHFDLQAVFVEERAISVSFQIALALSAVAQVDHACQL